MLTLYKGANVFVDGAFSRLDIATENGKIFELSPQISGEGFQAVFDFDGKFIFPGLADVHVHLREPGFSYKETIATGTAAAARGGFTDICAMPNLDPAPDSIVNIEIQQDIINKTAKIRVHPYACITKGGKGQGKLVDFDALAPYCCAFSDDGKGVQAGETMFKAMKNKRQIAAHCEDESLLNGGYIHDGEYAMAHNHRGISSESEWRQIERDIELVRKTGCDYHVCHVSTERGVEAIRRAKAQGLPVTCETAPHYLVLTDNDLQEDGRFKMNPPLRSERDRQALVAGLVDRTIDIIATDHAPHSLEEKSRGLEKSAFGIVGLETAVPLIYTHLVLKNIISLERMVEVMSIVPRQRFSLGHGKIFIGTTADFAVLDPSAEYTIDPEKFLSLGRATPFEGASVRGEIIMTVSDGECVWQKGGECSI